MLRPFGPLHHAPPSLRAPFPSAPAPLGDTAYPLSSLALCQSSTGWHCLSAVSFHLGLYPASENFLLTFICTLTGDLWLLLHGVLAVPALLSHSASPSAWPWMAREASQQAPFPFQLFPSKRNISMSGCQTTHHRDSPTYCFFLPFFTSRAKEVGGRFPMEEGGNYAEHCYCDLSVFYTWAGRGPAVRH